MTDTVISTPVVSKQPDPEKELQDVRSSTVSVRAEDYVLDLRFQQQVGRVQGFRAAASGLNLGVIQWFSTMKASGDYKGRTFEINGEIHSPKTFDELCDAMGFSRQSIYEALQNYATFGEERLTEIRNLGLTVRDTRKIRKAIKDVDEDTKKEIFRELKSSTPRRRPTTRSSKRKPPISRKRSKTSKKTGTPSKRWRRSETTRSRR